MSYSTCRLIIESLSVQIFRIWLKNEWKWPSKNLEADSWLSYPFVIYKSFIAFNNLRQNLCYLR